MKLHLNQRPHLSVKDAQIIAGSKLVKNELEADVKSFIVREGDVVE
jgi:hypothetical protein